MRTNNKHYNEQFKTSVACIYLENGLSVRQVQSQNFTDVTEIKKSSKMNVVSGDYTVRTTKR